MEWSEGIMIIASSGVGAICGILGQSIKDWWSRPRIKALAFIIGSDVMLYFANMGRRSTEDLTIEIVEYDGIAQAGNGKVIFHTKDAVVHPKTAMTLPFGHIEGQTLRIIKSDFGKILKYSDDGDEAQEEWTFNLPIRFYVSACAKDARMHAKMMTVDGNGIHLKNPARVGYSSLKGQLMFKDESDEK